jgi:hypothetical protein
LILLINIEERMKENKKDIFEDLLAESDKILQIV